jgi:hypothetical protein
MPKRDFSNRVCIPKDLVPLLKEYGEGRTYKTLSGIVDYILREHLSNVAVCSNQSPPPLQRQTTGADSLDFDIDLI